MRNKLIKTAFTGAAGAALVFGATACDGKVSINAGSSSAPSAGATTSGAKTGTKTGVKPAPAPGTKTSPATATGSHVYIGRISVVAPGRLSVAGHTGVLAKDATVYVAYGTCPDGSGTEGDTADPATNRGTKACPVTGLETWLKSNPLTGEVRITDGAIVKIVEHKGG
ncbi:hypothetical protein [Actinomadura macrotermitis]|uniref:Uncharacterized protein n=1 Tax=Actinomadura macrotermitis TaxID=2585200 RepID=A0A7K0BVP1_9ACTN|nr:hypothetical protein [Actinomadura macrotermitis]MQY05243.1 hypothetical protein [Actinomadura macrotermitis]